MWDEVSVSASFSMIISMAIAAMNSLQSKGARVVLCILETQSTRTRQYAILQYRAPSSRVVLHSFPGHQSNATCEPTPQSF